MPSSGEGAEDDDRNQDQIEHLVIDDPDAEQQSRDDAANRQNDEAWRERKHQRFHGTPRADFCRYRSCAPQPNPTLRTTLYTISGVDGHGYDSGSLRGYRIIRRKINPSAAGGYRRSFILQCSVT